MVQRDRLHKERCLTYTGPLVKVGRRKSPGTVKGRFISHRPPVKYTGQVRYSWEKIGYGRTSVNDLSEFTRKFSPKWRDVTDTYLPWRVRRPTVRHQNSYVFWPSPLFPYVTLYFRFIDERRRIVTKTSPNPLYL